MKSFVEQGFLWWISSNIFHPFWFHPCPHGKIFFHVILILSYGARNIPIICCPRHQNILKKILSCSCAWLTFTHSWNSVVAKTSNFLSSLVIGDMIKAKFLMNHLQKCAIPLKTWISWGVVGTGYWKQLENKQEMKASSS